MVAEAAASVPLAALSTGAAELDEHPLLDAARTAQSAPGRRGFLEALYGHLLVAGNAYVEAVAVEGAVRELYALRPDRMSVVPDAVGLAGGVRICGERTDGALRAGRRRAVAPILHLRAVPSARRSLRLSAARGGAGEPRRAQCGERLEQGAARQRGAALRRAGLQGRGRRQSFGRAVRAAARGARGEFFRRGECRAAAAARRRARLADDEPLAEGHGFHRS